MADHSDTPTTPSTLTNEWRAAAASAIGQSHAASKTGCQDAVHWRRAGGAREVLVAAVADGASSASLGRAGAEVASLAAVDAVCALAPAWPADTDGDAWRAALRQVVITACNALVAEAAARGAALDDLATTLVLVVATPGLVAAAQVGDGAAVVADEFGRLATITRPARGEYANTTTFLTTPDAVESAQIVAWPGRVAHVAAFSDGLQMLALNLADSAPHAPFFEPLFALIAGSSDERAAGAAIEQFLASPRVTERTDDDLTLFLGARLRTAAT
ncbi:MAG: PP2C family serine/threonine-protein phosphatase [Planctomycetota bacterium]